MDGHSSRLEQAENRISELEDQMEIKGQTKKLSLKQHKTVKGICKNSSTPSKD
jgi:hypothetical protein